MILDEILDYKRTEVEAAAAKISIAELKRICSDTPGPRNFEAALRSPKGRVGLIAEVKKASPSAGLICPDFDPGRQALSYEAAGADCLSVLTDRKFFQGSLDDLKAARAAVSIPVLRKDFVVSEYQIFEARAAGADCILLIVAALAPKQTADYRALAASLGLSVLVEAHSEDEMETAFNANATLIGINNRDLKTFNVDLATFERIAKSAGEQAALVAESGIKTRVDVTRVINAGAQAILVGETLMRSGDISASARELVGQ
jgi:indole-3-glycerol phosphate synthase